MFSSFWGGEEKGKRFAFSEDGSRQSGAPAWNKLGSYHFYRRRGGRDERLVCGKVGCFGKAYPSGIVPSGQLVPRNITPIFRKKYRCYFPEVALSLNRLGHVWWRIGRTPGLAVVCYELRVIDGAV